MVHKVKKRVDISGDEIFLPTSPEAIGEEQEELRATSLPTKPEDINLPTKPEDIEEE